MADKPSKLRIADREFTSRLLVGTGKFASNELMRDALVASGTEIVTVALRRADLSGKHDPFANILDFIDPKRFLLLPNTSGARNAEEAVRLARLGRDRRFADMGEARDSSRPALFASRSGRNLGRSGNSGEGGIHRVCLTSTPIRCWRKDCRMSGRQR